MKGDTLMHYNDEKRNFTLTATGDLFISRKLSPYMEPEYLELWDIVRSGSVRFTNLEQLIHEYYGYPVAESGGTYTQVDPSIIKELFWAGFNLLGRANNHSLDYGVEAMLRTSEILDAHDLCHAGVGRNLAEARSPRYMDLAEGRVSLLSASSTFASHGRAGHQRPDMMGRPGLNPVRFKTWYVVDAESLEKLREISKATGFETRKAAGIASGYLKPDKENELNFAQARFVLGDSPGIYTEVEKNDLEENLKWISDARRQSDFVTYSMHWHESGESVMEPAMYHQDYARACVDAGVDALLGHGPHVMRGIEIYKKRPIFYSLGNFVFQNETVYKFPADSYERVGLGHDATPADYYDKRSDHGKKSFPASAKYWESFVPWCRYEGGELVELKLYPVSLGFGKPRTVIGRPVLAKGEMAEKIIAQVAELSKPFGTEIEFKDDIGIVKL
jgi:poly-gamma-glutamate synthesis protein (capsule biosynthesis protein)